MGKSERGGNGEFVKAAYVAQLIEICRCRFYFVPIIYSFGNILSRRILTPRCFDFAFTSNHSHSFLGARTRSYDASSSS